MLDIKLGSDAKINPLKPQIDDGGGGVAKTAGEIRFSFFFSLNNQFVCLLNKKKRGRDCVDIIGEASLIASFQL